MSSRGDQGRITSDMDEHGDMKRDAKLWTEEAIDMAENKEEKDISKHIKRKFENKYGPTWHCVVGSDFKAQFSHESKHFIFMHVGKLSVLLYKC